MRTPPPAVHTQPASSQPDACWASISLHSLAGDSSRFLISTVSPASPTLHPPRLTQSPSPLDVTSWQAELRRPHGPGSGLPRCTGPSRQVSVCPLGPLFSLCLPHSASWGSRCSPDRRQRHGPTPRNGRNTINSEARVWFSSSDHEKARRPRGCPRVTKATDNALSEGKAVF